MNYDRIKDYYIRGLWADFMVRNAVTKGIITQEQADEIIASKQI